MDAGPIKRANGAENARRLGAPAEAARDAHPDATASAMRTLAAARADSGAPQQPSHAPSRPAGDTAPSSAAPGSTVVHFGPRAPTPQGPDYTHLKPTPPPAAREAPPAALASAIGQLESSLVADPSARVPPAQPAAPLAAASPATAAGPHGEAPFPSAVALATSTSSSPVAERPDAKPVVPAHAHRLPDRIAEIMVRPEVRVVPASRPRALVFALIMLLMLVYIW